MRRTIAMIAMSLAMTSAGAADMYGNSGYGSNTQYDRTASMGDLTYGNRTGAYTGGPAEAQQYSRSYANPRSCDERFGDLPNVYGGFEPSPDLEWNWTDNC